jgi:phospholipid/cholesterol/gamma-HCH transport system ATP-binding protein
MNEPNGKPAIALSDLHKRYGGQQVLNGVSLSIAEGESVAVLGRSGTGKSVLLKLIVGLQPPDSGSVEIHGREVTGASPEELSEVRLKVGFLFQEGALYDSLSLKENVAFPLRRHQRMSGTEQQDRARELLAEVGMERDVDKLPSEISVGMKKRVGLARALALDPDILLCDEPTAGLDPITSREIVEVILGLKKDRHVTSVVVTHDLHAARTVADRLALLHEGCIRIDGTFEDLKNSDDELVSQFMQQGS